MKKINTILLFTLLIGFLTACSDEDKGPVINPTAETGNMTFVLNQTRYIDFTYVLEEANNSFDMDALTTTQPNYGFTAAVSYYVQASFNEDMNEFVELPSSVQGENVTLNVKEMNSAIFNLYEGDMPNPSIEKDVFLRLKAVVSNASKSPFDSEPTVKPLFSNVIKLNILPYFVENLKTFYEVPKLKPYYIVGYTGWDNSVDGLGSDVIPMSVVEGSVYNDEGQGVFSYTGFFEASKTFKIIGVVGGWAEQWGNEGADGIDSPIHNDGGSSNFKVPKDGYYTITLNSITNQITFEEKTISPRVFGNMGMVGEMTDWGSTPDISLSPYQEVNNHIWYTEYTFTSESAFKFRYNSDWGDNWGSNKFPYGIATSNGDNIPGKPGTYFVIFNDIDGTYMFITK